MLLFGQRVFSCDSFLNRLRFFITFDLSSPTDQRRPIYGDNDIMAHDENTLSLAQDMRRNKRKRTIFTAEQLDRLEHEFQQQQYVVGQERKYLAVELGLNEIQVKVWFQNRRIKWRKQKSSRMAHGNMQIEEIEV